MGFEIIYEDVFCNPKSYMLDIFIYWFSCYCKHLKLGRTNGIKASSCNHAEIIKFRKPAVSRAGATQYAQQRRSERRLGETPPWQ